MNSKNCKSFGDIPKQSSTVSKQQEHHPAYCPVLCHLAETWKTLWLAASLQPYAFSRKSKMLEALTLSCMRLSLTRIMPILLHQGICQCRHQSIPGRLYSVQEWMRMVHYIVYWLVLLSDSSSASVSCGLKVSIQKGKIADKSMRFVNPQAKLLSRFH